MDEWIQAGRVVATTRTKLARSGIGVAVRAGASVLRRVHGRSELGHQCARGCRRLIQLLQRPAAARVILAQGMKRPPF